MFRVAAFLFSVRFVLQISIPSSHCQWSGVLWFIAIAIFTATSRDPYERRRSRTCGSIVLFDLCVHLMIFTKLNYCFIEEVSGFMGALRYAFLSYRAHCVTSFVFRFSANKVKTNKVHLLLQFIFRYRMEISANRWIRKHATCAKKGS